MMKLFSVLVVALLLLTGCNTMAGFGKDLKKVGNEIDQAATK
ncbi:entericidin A/B family lipoprotein [Deefgea salmonis]|uniref:Entericidin A/B family lipoprotein n=1 Tax=Deefgea salmonis TaxID=2875502 RepID=A0ABS8BI19_9NEIS|nr:entericidin A/B family lipoprotein [Deefgea salmonis]